MDIEYITEDVDYSIANFYDHFHTELPHIVRVSQGIQGDNSEHDFVKGEVLYIATVSKQKRVVAKVKCSQGQYTRVLGIPLTLSDNLCVSRFGKSGHEETLQDILKRHWLPVKVRYPPSDVIIMEDRSFSTNNLPYLELVKKFDEIHLLGKYLHNGKLGEEIIRIPVYLPLLRVCRVTGMKYLTREGWNKHCDTLKEDSKHTKYDLKFGNQHTAEYDQSNINAHTRYTFTEPLLHDELLKIIIRWPECNIGSSPELSQTKDIRSDEHCQDTSKEDTQAYECLIKENERLEIPYEAISLSNSKDKLTKDIQILNCDEVIDRLNNLGLEKYVEMFAAHKLDGDLLVHLDESLLMDEFGMTKAELMKLKDVSQPTKMETTAPKVPPRTYLRNQGVKQGETLVPNQKPKLLPKPYQKPSRMLIPHSSSDITTQRTFNDADQQCVHAEPNTYTRMPKQSTQLATTK